MLPCVAEPTWPRHGGARSGRAERVADALLHRPGSRVRTVGTGACHNIAKAIPVPRDGDACLGRLFRRGWVSAGDPLQYRPQFLPTSAADPVVGQGAGKSTAEF